MSNLKIITNEVQKLLSLDDSGHGMDHIKRVCKIAHSISEEDVNKEIVSAIALLHDVDDYKLFGLKASEELTNTKIILSKTNFGEKEKN